MIPSKASFMLVAVAVLALVAGLAVGTLSHRLIEESKSDNVGPIVAHSTLSEELGLTSDQREQMRTIWEAVEATSSDCQSKAMAAQKQRDDAIFDLLSDAQKVRYTEISAHCQGQIELLNSQRQAAFNAAVEKTKTILNDHQKEIYQQLVESRTGMHVQEDHPKNTASEQFAAR